MRITLLSIILFNVMGCVQMRTEGMEKLPGHMKFYSESFPPNSVQQDRHVDPSGKTIKSRYILPAGYDRVDVPAGSFAEYLRNLPLKEAGAKVKYYNGEIKPNHGVYAGVVDLPVGTKDLHQCADAIIRLRGEYLYNQRRYDEIKFNFTNGFTVAYDRWRAGNRIRVSGNKVWWVNSSAPSNNYHTFWQYLETIFTYAGTLSLSAEMKPKSINGILIGDVFIQGGSPGHAVIVVDMAEHKATGKRIFLLAQSFMPAQEIQVLCNPGNPGLNPWYPVNFGDKLFTPEWTFQKGDLKSFE
jgi:hypothetical protein